MSLEIAIQENTAVLKNLIAVLQSGQAIQLVEGATVASVAESADKPKTTRTRKTKEESPEGNAAPAPAEQPANTEEKTATIEPSATAPAVTASEAKPQATDVSFDDVTKKIIELNKSQKPGHGRDGVLSVLQQFLGGTEGKKVPDLKAVEKNAEIIAFVDNLLTGETAGDDDLGI